MLIRLSLKPKPVLTFDLENRPLSYIGGGFTSAEITAAAWNWSGEDVVHSAVLITGGIFVVDDLAVVYAREFFESGLIAALRRVAQEGGIATGHYIRKHDLPLLNSALLEFSLPPLEPLLVHDTHSDLVKKKDLSASQESLAAMYGLPEAKHHMSQAEWRRANRLTPRGIIEARKRVIDDVLQNKALRRAMLAAGALKPARWWKP